MNPMQFSNRIGNIDDQLIRQAGNARYEKPRPRRRARVALLLAAAVLLMVCGCAVGAAAAGAVRQETVTLDGLGLTLILPDQWKGKYGVDENGLYVKSIHESEGAWSGSGYLFWIVKFREEPMTPEEAAASAPVTDYRYLMATNSGTYLLYYASDLQYDPSNEEQTEEYETMMSEISQIQIVVNQIFPES